MSQMVSEPLTLRPAKPGEAKKLSDLALRSKAHWGYPPAMLRRFRKELTYTAEQICSDRFCFFVGEINHRCAGFYALSRTSADEAELEALFVEPEYIGNGLGRALIDHAGQTAAAWGATRLVIQGDPHAEGFYRAAGGMPGGRRESESIPGRYLPLFTIDLSSVKTKA